MQAWVELNRRQGRKEECRVHMGTPAMDTSSPLARSRLMGNRRDAHQGGDLAAVELSQFRETSDDPGSSLCSQSFQPIEQSQLVLPLTHLFHALGDPLVDTVDFALKLPQMDIDPCLDGLGCQTAAVGLCHPHFRQLTAPHQPIFHLLEFRGWRRIRFDRQGGAEDGEHPCVDAVGLGQDARGFGEIPGTFGIGPGRGNSCGTQCLPTGHLVAARDLQDHDIDRAMLVEPVDQLSHPLGSVGELPMLLESAMENIQTGLANIDANGDSFTEAHI